MIRRWRSLDSNIAKRVSLLEFFNSLSHNRKFATAAEEAVYRMFAMSRFSRQRSLCPVTCFGKSCA